jgi:hypothetical protein
MKVIVKRLKNGVSEECSKEGLQQHDESLSEGNNRIWGGGFAELIYGGEAETPGARFPAPRIRTFLDVNAGG